MSRGLRISSRSTKDTMLATNGTAKPGSRSRRRYAQVAHTVTGQTGNSAHANVFATLARSTSPGGWLMLPSCHANQPAK